MNSSHIVSSFYVLIFEQLRVLYEKVVLLAVCSSSRKRIEIVNQKFKISAVFLSHVIYSIMHDRKTGEIFKHKLTDYLSLKLEISKTSK